MSTKVKVSNNSIGFAGCLTLLFIALKLTGYIDWSWLWVLAPIWLPLFLVVVVMGAIVAVCFIHDVIVDGLRKRK